MSLCTAADFPAASGGIITLTAGTLYEINGTVTLTDKINLNGCTIKGADLLNDKLVYTASSGELFTGSNGGFIQNLILSATGASAKLFNLDAGGANKNLVMQTCFIVSCTNVGTIKGFGGKVTIGATSFLANTNGMTIQDCAKLTLQMNMWDNTNSNTYLTLTGTFSEIQVLDGYRATLSANAAVGINISGITSLTKGSLKNCMFTGTGTSVTGTFSSAWEIDSDGLTTQSDDQAYGSMYMTTATATAITAANIPLKAAGTTTASQLFRFTMPSSNRLQYTGTKTRVFTVTAALTTLGESDGKFTSIYLYKNGVVIPESKQHYKQVKSDEGQNVTMTCLVSLATNDYIEVWVEDNSDHRDITVDKMNVVIK